MENSMRTLTALACVIFLTADSMPAAACGGSRCALRGTFLGPRLPGQAVLGKCCGPVPRGWGWYLRQKLRADTSAPLVIVDELGGVILFRDQR